MEIHTWPPTGYDECLEQRKVVGEKNQRKNNAQIVLDIGISNNI